MTDEPETGEELGEIEVEANTDAEYIECEKGTLIFPYGAAWYADTHGFNCLFVDAKTGDVTGEDNATGLMRKPVKRSASLASIKGG